MRILIEEHKYPYDLVKDCLWDGVHAGPDGTVTFEYVGYYYNHTINECILFLPRVLLESDEEERVFVERDVNGNKIFEGYTPEQIFNPEAKDEAGKSRLKTQHRDFIREFAVWIYRAIDLYARTNGDEQNVILRKATPIMGHGRLRECYTLLDIILALLKFQRENYNFFITTLYERHRGQNKINWRKTVAKTPMMMTASGPLYANPINRKREIAFDEELFVIFYSILSYIRGEYGFKPLENPGFEELSSVKFQSYLKHYGKIRLLQIKGHYFSDRALQLWELCYAFFEHNYKIQINVHREEFLLAKNFNIVFESIIDELLGDRNIPEGLKDQRDGKRVDHIYKYRGLTDADDTDEKNIYYIGDSKYYKRRTKIGKEALYKQFTYARNVLQWNLDLFLDGGETSGETKYRDDKTEGYRIIPNFFISARIDDDWRYDHDEIKNTNFGSSDYMSRHFENRLFDRDTLLVAHYDVNFLFVISRYARNNKSEKATWSKKIREVFRARIRKMLEEKFDFYAITPKSTTDAEVFFKDHFRELLGHVYDAYGKRGGYEFYSLALRKGDEYQDENDFVLGLIESGFNVAGCTLGTKPEEIEGLTAEPRAMTPSRSTDHRTRYFLDNYQETDILLGFCKGEEHRAWMFNRQGNKNCDMYNIRLGSDRSGGQKIADVVNVKFLILYAENSEGDNTYQVYRLLGGHKHNKEWMDETGYPTASSKTKNYYCYQIDEEVSFGHLNIQECLTVLRMQAEGQGLYHEGMPFIVKGKDLLPYEI